MKSKYIFMLILMLSISILITGCFTKNEVKPSNSGDVIIESGESDVVSGEYVEVFGNESGVVNYKGDIYFIEYGNGDFAPEGIRDAYYGLNIYSNAQRYLNKIDTRGNVKNLFKVTASTSFSIVDDRFYLRSNNGQLYTVNMQGENSVDLAKGYYVGFDYPGHAVYYQNENTPDILYRINTETLSIKMYEFDNPTTNNNYNLLTIRNGILYYSLIDSKSNKLVLVQHDVLKNENKELAEIKLDEVKFEEDGIGNMFVCSDSVGEYAVVCVGVPCTGTIGGYYYGDGYTFDLVNNTIKKSFSLNDFEGSNYSDLSFYAKLEKELYRLKFSDELPEIDSFVSDKDRKDFAGVYNLDLDATLGNEAKNSGAFTEDSPKYYIGIEDHHVVGRKILYKVTASRANPTAEIGWRPAFIRIVTEVHIKDLETGEDQFIYSYVNEKYEDQVKDILKEVSNTVSGEEIDVVNDKTGEEELKSDEMYLEIKVNNIWKDEFDVRVEEEGSIIFGKRIEYEGHHKKADGTIKLKVSKEVGAMLTVFIDNERHSQVLIDENM